MRLFEIEDQFTNDLILLLRNNLGRGDSKHSPQPLTWPALSNELSNLGYGGISYDIFDKIYQENPQIQPLVKNYNEQGIELATKVQSEKPQDKIKTGIGAPTVQQMASRAVRREY